MIHRVRATLLALLTVVGLLAPLVDSEMRVDESTQDERAGGVPEDGRAVAAARSGDREVTPAPGSLHLTGHAPSVDVSTGAP